MYLDYIFLITLAIEPITFDLSYSLIDIKDYPSLNTSLLFYDISRIEKVEVKREEGS